MGPTALRTAGLARVLADLGHAVSDRGTLYEVEPVPVAMEPAAAERCRHLAEIAGWTRRACTTAPTPWRRRRGVPVFLGGDHAISMGTISGVARACAEAGRELVGALARRPCRLQHAGDHAVAATCTAWRSPSSPASRAWRRSSATGRSIRCRAANIHVFGVRSIDPASSARLRAHGVDVVDMRAIDERGVSALLAERHRRLAGARRARCTSASTSTSSTRRSRPASAPRCRAAPPTARRTWSWRCSATAGSSARSTWSSSIPSSTSAAAPRVVATELVASLFGRTVLDRQPGAVAAA